MDRAGDMQQAFFFDFDDTLYSHRRKCVPDSARDALMRLHRCGHIMAVVTGRGPESIPFIRQALGVPCETIVLLNGQLIFRNGARIFERFIAIPSMHRIIETAKRCGFAYGGYCRDGEIVNQLNSRVQAVWKDFCFPLPVVLEGFEQKYRLYQGHLYITKEEAGCFGDCLEEYVINWSHQYLVNLIPKKGGKSLGIYWLIQDYNVSKANTFAFGDGFNDMDMLLSVGHGIAMGNAQDDLKRIAEHVTDAVDDDGILHALEYYGITGNGS